MSPASAKAMAASLHNQHLLIIGGGASGTLAALRVRKSPLLSSLQISIVDPEPNLGRGRAYSTQDKEHLLNVPASRMSAYKEDPHHFEQWLLTQWNEGDFPYWPYVPRMLFGNYLSSLVAEELQKGSIKHVQSRVRDIKPSAKTYLAQLEDGNTLVADYVFVATGYARGYGSLETHLSQLHKRNLQGSSPKKEPQKILIVGSGLSAIDEWRSLRSKSVDITFLSRHGLFPLPARLSSDHLKLVVPDGLSPRQLLAFLREAALSRSWAEIADVLRPKAQRIWSTWTTDEKRQFLRHLKHYWEIIRHRVPEKIAQELNVVIQSGSARIMAARIISINLRNDGYVVEARTRGTSKVTELEFDRILLATGSHIEQDLAPWLSKCGVRTCPHGFGYRAEDAPRIWCLGPAAKSTYWEITAVPEIRVQVETSIKELEFEAERPRRNLKIEHLFIHPESVRETYSQHLLFAARFAALLAKYAFLLLAHAILPWNYPDRVSNDLRDIVKRLSKRRERTTTT